MPNLLEELNFKDGNDIDELHEKLKSRDALGEFFNHKAFHLNLTCARHPIVNFEQGRTLGGGVTPPQ